MRRLLDGFYRTLMALAALAMVAAFLSVVVGIADREFALGLRGLDAYAGYAIAAALFFALPATLQRGEHIRVTLLLQRLPPAWRGALEWWCLTAALLLSSMLAWFAVRMTLVSRATHDVSQGSDATPLWIPQIAMALGCIGLAVAFADAFVSRLLRRPFFEERAANDAARME